MAQKNNLRTRGNKSPPRLEVYGTWRFLRMFVHILSFFP